MRQVRGCWLDRLRASPGRLIERHALAALNPRPWPPQDIASQTHRSLAKRSGVCKGRALGRFADLKRCRPSITKGG